MSVACCSTYLPFSSSPSSFHASPASRLGRLPYLSRRKYENAGVARLGRLGISLASAGDSASPAPSASRLGVASSPLASPSPSASGTPAASPSASSPSSSGTPAIIALTMASALSSAFAGVSPSNLRVCTGNGDSATSDSATSDSAASCSSPPCTLSACTLSDSSAKSGSSASSGSGTSTGSPVDISHRTGLGGSAFLGVVVP